MEEKEYEITIREVLERKVVMRGISERAALEHVQDNYRAEKIVLDADDFSYNEFFSRPIVPSKDRGR